jgi:outer membrane biosynthesis protein TonB
MGRLSASLLALALAAALATGVSACGGGSSDLLPGTTASEINSNLDEVQQLVSEGDCVGAADAASTVSAQVEELGGVDAKLKQALSEGANRLNEVVAGCEEVPNEAEEAEQAEIEAEEQAAAEAEEESEKPKKKEKEKETGKPEKEAGPQTEPPEPPGQEKQEEGVEEELPPTETESGSGAGGVGPGAAVGAE